MKLLFLLLSLILAVTILGQKAAFAQNSMKEWQDSSTLVEIKKQNLILLDSINLIKVSTIEMIEELKKEATKSQLTTNIITISLALVAAFIALYQVKANVVSNARIKWIEDLRHNLSEFLEGAQLQQSLFSDIIGKQKRYGQKEYAGFWEDFAKFNEAQSRTIRMHSKIKLYLSSDKQVHKEIETKLDEIQSKLSTKQPDVHTKENGDAIANLVDETIVLCKTAFKEEWRKSKKIFRF